MVPNFEFCHTLLCKGWIGLQKANNLYQVHQLNFIWFSKTSVFKALLLLGIEIKNFMKSLKSFDILIAHTPFNKFLTQGKLVNL